MRVIGNAGEQLGIMPLEQALRLAREKQLDLVEVAPHAQPPVCRLLDYGKLRYFQTKKEREARKAQKLTIVREVRFRPNISEHDMAPKTRKVRELLEEGAKVKLSVFFRGREVTHPELGLSLLKRIADELKEEAKLERPPALEGRSLSIVLAPAPRKAVKAGEKREEVKEDAKA